VASLFAIEALRSGVSVAELREEGFRFGDSGVRDQWRVGYFRHREQDRAGWGGLWGQLEWLGSAVFPVVAGAGAVQARGEFGESGGWE